MHYVYQIKFKEIPIYIGRTNDLKRRTYEHNYNLKNYLNSGNPKTSKIYKYIAHMTDMVTIELEPIRTFKTKVQSKRYEMFLILKDYFRAIGGNLDNGSALELTLKQKVPNISDR